jgi:hypothetical protein
MDLKGFRFQAVVTQQREPRLKQRGRMLVPGPLNPFRQVEAIHRLEPGPIDIEPCVTTVAAVRTVTVPKTAARQNCLSPKRAAHIG